MKKLIAIIFMTIFLSGCIKQPQNDNKIVFSAWGSKSEIKIVKEIIKDFEEENPDTEIEFMHIPQNYFQKLHLLFASKTPPDVIFMNNYYIPLYIKANLLEDLSPYIDKEKYYENTLKCFSNNEKIYAIPRDVSVLNIYYNKDIFDKNKIPYPEENWTQEDFLNILLKIKKQNNIWGISFENTPLYYLGYLFSNGGGIVENNKIILNKKETLEELQFYSDLVNKYQVAPKKSDSASLTMTQMFLQGKLAMILTGPWVIPKFREEAKFDWDIINLPNGKKGSVMNLDSSGYALNKNSKNKEKSIKFIQYITNEKNIEKFTKTGLIIPARKDILNNYFILLKEKPENKKVYNFIINNSKPTEISDNHQKVQTLLQQQLEPAFLGKKKVNEVINEDFIKKLNETIE